MATWREALTLDNMIIHKPTSSIMYQRSSDQQYGAVLRPNQESGFAHLSGIPGVEIDARCVALGIDDSQWNHYVSKNFDGK